MSNVIEWIVTFFDETNKIVHTEIISWLGPTVRDKDYVLFCALREVENRGEVVEFDHYIIRKKW